MAAEVRQDLVEEAQRFLSNPKVITEKEENKRAFLQKKGLTEEEINIAFSMVPKNLIISGSTSSPALGSPVPYISQQPSSRWLQIRDFANLVLILSGASYGIHYIYKFYVGPLLTGRQEKSVEESMIELQQSVVAVLKDVQSTLSTLEQTLSVQTTKIQALNNEKTTEVATKRQLDELKTEITSLKGLLVNKRSFPAPPSLSAGIPSWQLSSGSSITSSIASNLANGSNTNGPTESTTETNGLNVLSNTSNIHSNSSTENRLVDDDTIGKVAVTDASIISTTNANITSSIGSSLANGSSTNGPTESTTETNGLNVLSNISNVHSNSNTENGLVDDDTVVKEASSISTTNVLSPIPNVHSNSSTENGVEDDTVVKVAVTNASSISTTNANETHDTQVTVENTELASTEKDLLNSHSNDLIKTDFDDTSEKKEVVEDTIITDSSDEISQ